MRFDYEKRHGEDWKFNLELLCAQDLKLSSIDASLYNYENTPNGLSKTYKEINANGMFKSAQLLLDINNKFNLDKEICVYRDVAIGLISVGISLCNNKNRKSKYSALTTFLHHPLAIKTLQRINYLDLSLKNKILVRLLSSNNLGRLLFTLLNKMKH